MATKRVTQSQTGPKPLDNVLKSKSLATGSKSAQNAEPWSRRIKVVGIVESLKIVQGTVDLFTRPIESKEPPRNREPDQFSQPNGSKEPDRNRTIPRANGPLEPVQN